MNKRILMWLRLVLQAAARWVSYDEDGWLSVVPRAGGRRQPAQTDFGADPIQLVIWGHNAALEFVVIERMDYAAAIQAFHIEKVRKCGSDKREATNDIRRYWASLELFMHHQHATRLLASMQAEEVDPPAGLRRRS